MSKRILPSNEKLYDLYVNEKKTMKDICRMYGLKTNSSGNISRMLQKMGVEIRKDAGKYHHNWKGGRIQKGGSGYIGIWKPNHERADKQGYVYEHTLIIEKKYGRLPNEHEAVHHIDFNKKNNNENNLILVTHKEHMRLHRKLTTLIKECYKNGFIYFDKNDKEYKLKERKNYDKN